MWVGDSFSLPLSSSHRYTIMQAKVRRQKALDRSCSKHILSKAAQISILLMQNNFKFRHLIIQSVQILTL